MKFRPVYYMISGWPSIEKTKEMVRRYVERGVTALQFDMPAADPSREAQFIQDCMRHARNLYGDKYDVFMDMLRDIRKEHPGLEIHLVVYADVVETIGLERFADFCIEIGAYSVLAGDKEKMDYLDSRGISTATFIGYDTSDKAIELAKLSDNKIVFVSNANGRTQPREGLITWADRIGYIRRQGVTAPIFGVTGIKTPEELQKVKSAGADGAYIGSIMMQLWERETELWELLDKFQAIAE